MASKNQWFVGQSRYALRGLEKHSRLYHSVGHKGSEMKIEAYERVEILESLVEELLKDAPNEELVESKMKHLNIPYSNDPTDRINRVLEALHPYQVMEFEE